MASRRRQRRQSCAGKQKYDKQGALHQATRLRRKDGSSMDAYHCAFCGAWHVGHRPSHVQKAINDRRRQEARRGY